MENFLDWVKNCCEEFEIIKCKDGNSFLSACGCDGPDITKEGLVDFDGNVIPFNDPMAIEKFLTDSGYYEDFENIELEYKPPTVHYIDWVNKYSKKHVADI